MNLSCYFLEKEQFQESCDIFEWKKIEYKGDSFTPRTGHVLFLFFYFNFSNIINYY